MATRLYIVLMLRNQWWIDLEGKSTGPFGDLDVAVASAIAMAEGAARSGARTEVRIAGPGHDNRVVYQSVASKTLKSLSTLETS